MIDTREMSMKDMEENAAAACALLKALAHEGRLMILCHLASETELSVGALESRLNKRQAAVSQLLSRLREDGMVATRRDGKTVYYSLAPGPAAQILHTLHGIYCA
ncbi:metalloregulator ArsR/SmtB family transcription factor [Phaeobacter sp. B1627]|uniref:ArsR/SmtB family transcription factor n=1 Tax=Phaeobacter sp. B1627 TaxID=2583809 RepID=UPI00210521D0|nr:metalloregulator ArsR/SmtB family transcription factor [Phaeobacter sp. B1627]